MSFQMVLLHVLLFGDAADRFGTMSFQMVLLPWGCTCTFHLKFWNYVIPDGSTTAGISGFPVREFWNYVIPDGSTTLIAYL